jgi:CHASE2 domain-containing sensor protein
VYNSLDFQSQEGNVAEIVGQTRPPIVPGTPVSGIPPWLRNLIAYLVGFAVLVGMTLIEHGPAQPADAGEGEHREFWSPDFWYERVVGAPDPRDRHVTVITIGKDMKKDLPLGVKPETNPKGKTTTNAKSAEHEVAANVKAAKAETAALPDACRRRIYLSELLKALASFYPKVVVLDIWLDPELCSEKGITRSLSDQLGQFSRQAPIVLGVPSRNAADLRAESPAELAYMANRKPPLRSTELVLMPVTDLSQQPGGRVTVAVVRRDLDARRIPLSWPVYDGFPDVGSGVQPKRKDTLSVAAVRAFDPHHPILRTIDALNADGSWKTSTDSYPYTSLLREDQFPIERAIDVICSSSLDESWRTACARTQVFNVTPDMFRDKIVVIGIVGLGSDIHQTVLGRVPGVILQANYIESLLSNRVYKALPLWTDLLGGAIWLGAVFTIAFRFRSHPILALTFSLLATIVPAYLVLKVLIWSGYYTELLIPLAIAAVVTNITVQFHHFLIHQGGGTP